jgi:hypothetical protein
VTTFGDVFGDALAFGVVFGDALAFGDVLGNFFDALAFGDRRDLVTFIYVIICSNRNPMNHNHKYAASG